MAERSSDAPRARCGLLRSACPLGTLIAATALAAACGGAAATRPPAVAASAPSSSAPANLDSGLAVPLALSTAPAASDAPSPSAVASVVPPPPPPNPRSTKVTWKSDPAWAACHRDFKAAKKDVSTDVAALAAGCAKVTRLKRAGKTLTGQQSDDSRPQTFPFEAEAHRCYRVYAQASDGIKNLVVVVRDSTGAVAGEVSTDDSSAVLPDDGAVCFTEADGATLVVSVGMGKGSYALEVWSD